jgi:hypothetical protein
MENCNIIREMKEKICNLEQAVFMASALIRKYEQILDRNPNEEWTRVRDEILNESAKLKK